MMDGPIMDFARYWPYAVALAIGAVCAVVDPRLFSRRYLAAVLVVIALAGAAGMNLSPFTFHGGDYYMESLIAMVAALVALGGYALAWAGSCACSCACRREEKTP